MKRRRKVLRIINYENYFNQFVRINEKNAKWRYLIIKQN
jgi:hypothetical protein